MSTGRVIGGLVLVVLCGVFGFFLGQETGGGSAVEGAILGALLVLIYKDAR
jgi:hypothetical protein